MSSKAKHQESFFNSYFFILQVCLLPIVYWSSDIFNSLKRYCKYLVINVEMFSKFFWYLVSCYTNNFTLINKLIFFFDFTCSFVRFHCFLFVLFWGGTVTCSPARQAQYVAKFREVNSWFICLHPECGVTGRHQHTQLYL